MTQSPVNSTFAGVVTFDTKTRDVKIAKGTVNTDSKAAIGKYALTF